MKSSYIMICEQRDNSRNLGSLTPQSLTAHLLRRGAPPATREGSLMGDHDQAAGDVDGLTCDVFRIR
jgi:hypothetical protein